MPKFTLEKKLSWTIKELEEDQRDGWVACDRSGLHVDRSKWKKKTCCADPT